MTRWVRGALHASIAFALSCGVVAASSLQIPGPIAARDADVIVLVESVSKSIDLDDRLQFHTTYQFQTLRAIKGNIGEEIEFRFRGLRPADRASVAMPEDVQQVMLSTDVPDGPPGSRFILLLVSQPGGGRLALSTYYKVHGEIDDPEASVNDPDIFMFHADDGSPYSASKSGVPLEDFIYSLVAANREIPLADPSPPSAFQSIVISDSASWLAAEPSGCLVLTHRLVAGSDLRWTGQCVDGRLEGEGTLEWVFDGEVVHEIMARFENGRSAYGRYEFPNGDTYSGRLSEGIVFNASGSYTFFHGTSYHGQFKNGIPDGKGTFEDPEGVSYRGEFVGGLRHGIGVCYDAAEPDTWPALCEYRNDRFYVWL